jgi:rRNA-processing protein EBP2
MSSYKIALDQVAIARKLCNKADIPFTRPTDYYAEMVKSDDHMERIRTKLVEESCVTPHSLSDLLGKGSKSPKTRGNSESSRSLASRSNTKRSSSGRWRKRASKTRFKASRGVRDTSAFEDLR